MNAYLALWAGVGPFGAVTGVNLCAIFDENTAITVGNDGLAQALTGLSRMSAVTPGWLRMPLRC